MACVTPAHTAWTVNNTGQSIADLIRYVFSGASFCLCSRCFRHSKQRCRRGFSKSAAALNGAVEHLATVAACCYFIVSSFGQRLAPIWVIRSLPLLPGWWGVSTSELLHKCWWKGQLAVRCDVLRGVTLLISQWPSDVSARSSVDGGCHCRQHPERQKRRTVWWTQRRAKPVYNARNTVHTAPLFICILQHPRQHYSIPFKWSLFF